jgi:RHS repeat-associated protein
MRRRKDSPPTIHRAANESTLSLSIWFKTSNAAYMGLVGQGNPYFPSGSGPTQEGYDLRYFGATTKELQLILNGDPSGNLTLGYTRPDDSGTSGVDESVLHDGQWHHVVVTIDNTASGDDELIKIYFDGVEVASTANTQVGDVEGSQAFVGGKPSGTSSGYFNGYLDDLRVFHDVLSAADVAELGRTQEALYQTSRRVEYTYDAFDRRIKKAIDEDADGDLTESADAVWQYVYDGQDIILAFDKANALKNRYLHGPAVDQILADEQYGGDSLHDEPATETGNVYWPLADHQGSIRDWVENDGDVARHTVFDAFGNIQAGETGTSLKFIYGYTGRERDDESIFDYHRARYYVTSLGVWAAADPGGFAMGDENLYRYVGNAPTNYTDPSGLVIGGAAAGAAGAAASRTGGGTGTPASDGGFFGGVQNAIDDAKKAIDEARNKWDSLNEEEKDALRDALQTMLDIIGIIEPTPIADGASAAISYERGYYWEMILCGVSMASYVGDISKLFKIPKWIERIDNALRTALKSEKLRDILKPLFKAMDKAIDSVPESIKGRLPDSVKEGMDDVQKKIKGFLEPPKGTKGVLDGLPGKVGKTGPIKEVPDAKSLDDLFDELTKGGKTVDPGTYPGIVKELPDGTKIRRRPGSRSGGATLDITLPDGTIIKVHIK